MPTPTGANSNPILAPRGSAYPNLHFSVKPPPDVAGADINDALYIEHCQSSTHVYSIAQREGIPDPFPHVSQYFERIEASCNDSFQPQGPAPLPGDLAQAIAFNSDDDLWAAQSFRENQIRRLRTISEESHLTDRWCLSTFDPIKSATGKIHLTLLARLVEFTGAKDSRWLTQSLTGFPITGCLRQASTFPLNPDTPKSFVDPDTLFAPIPTCFKDWEPSAVSKNAEHLWDEATEQDAAGWLAKPRPLNENDRPPNTQRGGAT